MSLAQKLIARAAARDYVAVGEIVTARLDLAMIHDSGGPRRVAPILERLGVDLWDPARVVLIADHFAPGGTEAADGILDLTRRWARARDVAFYDGQGICHVVLPERGWLRPGMFVLGGDSHSPTGGAFGAYMFGVGATDMAGALAMGETWIKTPQTIRIEISGKLGPLVSAKDVILDLCGRIGMGGGRYQAIEYGGEAVRAMDMQERMTLSNMAAELGAQAGLIAPDEVTAAYISAAGSDPGDWRRWRSDAEAEASETHEIDGAALGPQIAAPHSPANAAPARDYNEALDVAYIGACTGAKYIDLQNAARILKGRTSRLKLLVAPASIRDLRRAKEDGIAAILEQAGAEFLPSACGICAGYGEARLGEDIRCVSSTARNFKGRMGAASSRVWLASPFTVAASAVAGRLIDPRDVMEGG